jgi:hypothetical protein
VTKNLDVEHQIKPQDGEQETGASGDERAHPGQYPNAALRQHECAASS